VKLSILPSAERLVALGLAVAGLTILGLAFLVVSDLARESELHEEVMAVQQAQDALEALRVQVNELVAAARLGAATGGAGAFRNVERRSAEIHARLDALRADDGPAIPSLDVLVPQARLLVVHARSVAPAWTQHGGEAAASAAGNAEKVAAEVGATLDATIESLTTRVSDRSLARILIERSLRRYVAWFVAGSLVALAVLFVAFRRAQALARTALRRIEWLAHFDSVTGLPNRALLGDRLAQEAARARRAEEVFAVLLFDLDGFKSVNDTWGHSAGDRVLAAVAERARKCMRASDTVGRLGGDEFLAILPGTGDEGALAVAEKLRIVLREPYALDGAVANIGASIGVSLFPLHGSDPESLQRAADAALYEAKREGKDRARLAANPSRPQERNAPAAPALPA
jgi:diguanylate cyclase (GGDEF)-like protein